MRRSCTLLPRIGRLSAALLDACTENYALERVARVFFSCTRVEMTRSDGDDGMNSERWDEEKKTCGACLSHAALISVIYRPSAFCGSAAAVLPVFALRLSARALTLMPLMRWHGLVDIGSGKWREGELAWSFNYFNHAFWLHNIRGKCHMELGWGTQN